MNPDWLLKHFEQISEAPDAVPRLRRFILDLAVRGKLVEQDPADEPAAELLKRIQAKKPKLIRGRGGAKGRALVITEDETPFEIPETWVWVQSTEPAVLISDKGKKLQTKDVLESGEFPVVDQGKVFIRGYCNDIQKVIRIGGPIIVFGDHTRETKLIDFDFVAGADGVKLLKPIEIDPAYYFLALQWVPLDSRGYARHFKLLRASRIPLPPLAEQHRIVAKVDELMALCDELEAAQAKRERRRDRLVSATLHGLNNGDAIPENGTRPTFEESARFYFNHLPRLTTRPEHIHQLRQTILNLAVRGKLVPQDPKDEQASELLKRIEAEKARIAKEGKSPRLRRIPMQDVEGFPCEVPTNWKWCRLAEVSLRIHYGYTASANSSLREVRLLRITDIQNNTVHWDSVPGCEIVGERVDQYLLADGDILIARTGGTIGKSFLVKDVPVRAVFASYLIRVQGSQELFDRYLKLFFESPVYWKQLEEGARGTGQPNVNGQSLGNMAVPLPPFPEQHRIVAKVDELMALCDELEARITATATNRRQLLEATLSEALAV